MNILNNGRFGMAAALSGTMKKTIEKAVGYSRSEVSCVIHTLYVGGACHYQSTVWKQAGDIWSSSGQDSQDGTVAVRHRGMSALFSIPLTTVPQSIAYMLSGNMDTGSPEYQLEAAISKIFASVSALTL